MIQSFNQWRSQLLLTGGGDGGDGGGREGQGIFQVGKALKNSSVLTTLYRKRPIFFLISPKVGGKTGGKIFYVGTIAP